MTDDTIIDNGMADQSVTDKPKTYSTGSLQAELEQILDIYEIIENGLPAMYDLRTTSQRVTEAILATVSKHLPEEITENTSDGYHTFKELYEFRKLYNALFFNTIPDYCHKSYRHSDGELCFGGGWFIVVGYLNGDKSQQISNHYENKDWGLFHCDERERADEWDGHTPQYVAKRLNTAITVMEKLLGGNK